MRTVATVAVVGRDGDLLCRSVRERLTGRGARVVYLPESDVLPGLEFAQELSGDEARGVLGYGGVRTAIEDLDAVFARSFGIVGPPEDFDDDDGRYISVEWQALVRGWLHSLPCTVVDRLRPELWYRSQLGPAELRHLVPECPFETPRTLVTTSVADALAFVDEVGGEVRYAPLTLPATYRLDGPGDLERLEALSRHLPLRLVERIDGRRVEAVVTGGQVLLRPAAATDEAAGSCLRLARALGVVLCGLRLVERPDGRWFCVGADVTPHLVTLGPEESATVVDRLADVLLGEAAAA